MICVYSRILYRFGGRNRGNMGKEIKKEKSGKSGKGRSGVLLNKDKDVVFVKRKNFERRGLKWGNNKTKEYKTNSQEWRVEYPANKSGDHSPPDSESPSSSDDASW